MAAPIRAFFHTSQNTTSAPGVDNVFHTDHRHNHNLLDGAVPFMAGRAFTGRIEAIVVKVSSIAGVASKCTMRLCLDAAGDHVVIPDTEATLVTGVTTATDGSVAYSVGVVLSQTIAGSLGNFYLFVKADVVNGFTLDSSTITWSES